MIDIKVARQTLHDLKEEGRTMLDTIKAEDRSPTDAEEEALSALEAKIDDAAAVVSKREAEMDRERAFAVDPNARITGGNDRVESDPQGGWGSFGEFCMGVHKGSAPNGPRDPRLFFAAPTSPQNEGSGADGGYLVPPGFASTILSHSIEEDAFLPMTDNDDVEGNGMTWPRDEDTPWATDGVLAYWTAEAAQLTESKATLGTFTQRLHKLTVLVGVTDELLADASAMTGFVSRKAGEKIRWKTNNAIINGTGAGQPMGVLTAPATVTQAKEGSQTADTIEAANVVKMFARNTNPGRAVWLVNSDAWHQLPLMTLGDQPIFLPNNSITGTPGGILLGRPVIMSETCQTLGDLGDIQFIDFGSYKTITKAGGISTATSMHLWFDYDVMAFRAIFRLDGAPWASAAITPPNSSVTKSGFVQLAARA